MLNEARTWALLFLVCGHLGILSALGLGLWHLVLLDLWLVPLAFAAGDSAKRNHQEASGNEYAEKI